MLCYLFSFGRKKKLKIEIMYYSSAKFTFYSYIFNNSMKYRNVLIRSILYFRISKYSILVNRVPCINS